MVNIRINSPCPEFDLAASTGQRVALTDTHSKAHASQLGWLFPQFKTADCEVALILGDSVEKAQLYAQILHLPFLVLADPERAMYPFELI